MIGSRGEAIIVTTPQQVAVDDVRRSITFCRTVGVPVAGVIENMSGFVCPTCGARHDLFSSDGGKRLAEEMGVPYLGSVPIDSAITRSGDDGKPFVLGEASPAAEAFSDIVSTLTGNRTT
jgi:Mrp family chromosome partitioning ATPase